MRREARVGKRQSKTEYLPRPTRLYKRCLDIEDMSVKKIEAMDLFRINDKRDVATLARLSDQWIDNNRGIFSHYDVSVNKTFDGNSVDIILRTGNKIGALPLLSPITGKPDFGLVIKPRFDWIGLGSMLTIMGWRVIPTLVKLPIVPGTERQIPSWVLSTMVLHRLKQLMQNLDRRFEFTNTHLTAPKGTVKWNEYATQKIPKASLLSVPCRFPDIMENNDLLAGIHFTLNSHQSSLQNQRSAGAAVIYLLDLCGRLIQRVKHIAPRQPSKIMLNAWYGAQFKADVFRDGIQAIQWTVDDQGLAGIGDIQGLPWMLSMEEFFEAWLETVVEKIAKSSGGELKVGRRGQTITPIAWDKPYFGTQKYLLPDILLKRGNELVIFDAKYKEHWEELKSVRWSTLNDEIREQHRSDILQVLAYASVYNCETITCCLIYPCRKQTWLSLKERGEVYRKANLYAGKRNLRLVLSALPMDNMDDQYLVPLIRAIYPN